MSKIFLSNLALCATRGRFPIHSLKRLVTTSSFSASLTSSSLIFVTRVMASSIWCPGLINSSKRSTTSPFFTLTAPSSIIESPSPGLKPVVSVSNTTKVLSSIKSSLALKQTFKKLSHISSSTP